METAVDMAGHEVDLLAVTGTAHSGYSPLLCTISSSSSFAQEKQKKVSSNRVQSRNIAHLEREPAAGGRLRSESRRYVAPCVITDGLARIGPTKIDSP